MGQKARENTGKIMYELLIFLLQKTEWGSYDMARGEGTYICEGRWRHEMETAVFADGSFGLHGRLLGHALLFWNKNGTGDWTNTTRRGDSCTGH
jgi:hypothetical protein